jgi:hypothetical protein
MTNHSFLHRNLLIGLLAGALLVPVVTSASTVLRSGETLSIGQDQIIEGDLYMAGNIISVSGQVVEDFLVAGAEINLNGQVGADMLAVGANIDINGTVGDDLRVIGNNVVVAEPVLGDLFVVGANVKLLSTASVSGDVTVLGGAVLIEAPVEGNILGWVEELRVNANVTGDVKVTTPALTVGDSANIAGNVEYVSSVPLVRSQSSTISGEVVRSDPPQSEVVLDNPTPLLISLLGWLFSVALWFLVSRQSLQRLVRRTLLPSVRAVVIGGAAVLLVPFAMVVLLVSGLGLLPGLVLVATYVLLFTLAVIALPVVVAQFLMTISMQQSPPITLLTLLSGVVAVGLIALVPFVGPIVLTGFFILTFGALVDLLLRAIR